MAGGGIVARVHGEDDGFGVVDGVAEERRRADKVDVLTLRGDVGLDGARKGEGERGGQGERGGHVESTHIRRDRRG